MKRFAFTLAALALTGAMAFADDAAPVTKVTGYLDTGFYVINTSNGLSTQAYAKDAGIPGYRAKVTASQTAANYGVSLTLEQNNGAAVTPDSYTAWVSPLAGLKISGGSDYDGAVNGLDDIGNGFGNPGVMAVDYSMSGLTAAVIAQAPSAGGPAPIGFGARYAMDKVATVNFNGTLNASQKFDGYSLSASLAAVPNLTLVGGLYSTGVATTAASKIDLNVGYAISDTLSVAVLSYYALTDNSGVFTVSKSGDFWTKPNVTYKLNSMATLTGYVQYDSTANSNIEPSANVAFAVGGTTLNIGGKFDTNPTHASSAVATTTGWVATTFTF
jgi:hypothetical protein